MIFANSQMLALLFLCIPVAFILWFIFRNKYKRVLLFLGSGLGKIFWEKHFNKTGAIYKSILIILSVASIVLALAKPQWGFVWENIYVHGTDIVIAIDVSNSMLATDIKPNRLTVAKRKILDLLNVLDADRVALVAFSGYAVRLCPLTSDYQAITMFAEYLSPSLISLGGTNISDTINTSVSFLKEFSPQESVGKFIIMITDGENTSNIDPITEAKIAAQNNIKIFTIGIGTTEPSPIVQEDGTFKRDHMGNIVLSKLNESTLQSIADITGGIYMRFTLDDMDLQTIYKKYIRKDISLADTKGQPVNKKKVWADRFQWFVLFAILCLFIEFLIQDFFVSSLSKKASATILHKGLYCFFVFGLSCILGTSTLLASSIQDAFKAYKNKEYDNSWKAFESAEIDNPTSFELAYNKAVAAYRAGRYYKAKQGFEKSSKTSNKDLAFKSYFNLGNTNVALSDLPNAIKAYEKALEINPNSEEAQKNLDYVKKLIEEQKKQTQSNSNNDKNQQSQDKQDKMSQNNSNNVQNQNDANSSKDGVNNNKSNINSTTEDMNNTTDNNTQEAKHPQNFDKDKQQRSDKQLNSDLQQYKEHKIDEYQAEQLLKSVPDKIDKYLYRIPQQEKQKKAENLNKYKDW